MGTGTESNEPKSEEGTKHKQSAVVTELKEAALHFSGCEAFNCPLGSECFSYQRLRLASFNHVRFILDRIAKKRTEAVDPSLTEWKDKGGHLASARAMREVADELEVVVKEMEYEIMAKANTLNTGPKH